MFTNICLGIANSIVVVGLNGFGEFFTNNEIHDLKKKILLESQKFRNFLSEKNPLEHTLHPQISIVHPYRRNLLVLDK